MSTQTHTRRGNIHLHSRCHDHVNILKTVEGECALRHRVHMKVYKVTMHFSSNVTHSELLGHRSQAVWRVESPAQDEVTPQKPQRAAFLDATGVRQPLGAQPLLEDKS